MLPSLIRTVSVALTAATVVACSSRASNDSADAGPPIPLDTSAVSRVRTEWRTADSLLRSDTSAKNRDGRALVRTFVDLRTLNAQDMLGRLGYGVPASGELDATTRRALSDFAKRHGLPATDSLTPEIDVALRYADDRTFYPFGLQDSSVWTSAWSLPRNASIHAIGTWSPADPPRQTSNIWCYRETRVCREAVAYVRSGNLYTDIVEYDVDSWDAEELTAHSSSVCMVDKLTINRSQASAVLIRSARGAGIELCDRTRAANKESVARLVSGNTVSNALSREGLPFLHLGHKASELMRQLLDTLPAKP